MNLFELPPSKFEPRDGVGLGFVDDELDGDCPRGVVTRCEDHHVAGDSPTVAEHLNDVVSRLNLWFWAHSHVHRTAGVNHYPVARWTLCVVWHYRTRDRNVQILTRTRIYQPRLIVAVFLKYSNTPLSHRYSWTYSFSMGIIFLIIISIINFRKQLDASYLHKKRNVSPIEVLWMLFRSMDTFDHRNCNWFFPEFLVKSKFLNDVDIN